ncbi:ABC transporter permease [Georgenia thermotolerans]|uniref:ABC transporter permease subunit n=1 Tax=Georgenia thermotolerans TaxID=527326 RepID=A0A7J5UL34_9MICO|nr:ABC transporter permease [Georgenia thermotolerans]KAE8763095.1 ABC transporter permease subunit [Georgenia thermotolerans]
MLRYLARRSAGYALLLVLAVSLTYLLAASVLDPRSLYELRNPPLPPEAVEATLRAANLSDAVPLAERYLTWLRGVATAWDWGRTPTGASVNAEVGARLWVSLRLVTLGTLLGTVAGVAVGAWAAVRHHRAGDRLVTLAALVVISTPTLVLAVVLQIVAVRVNAAAGVQVFEFLGESGAHGPGWLAATGDRLQHLVLPTLTLAAGQAAFFSRIQRGLLLDTLGAAYVRAARARGLRRAVAVRRHALRTALVPTGTYLAYTVTTLVLGAAFVESVYGWHGMGIYGVQAIAGQDVNGTVAVAAFGGACVLAGALLADLLTVALDPRVRLS